MFSITRDRGQTIALPSRSGEFCSIEKIMYSVSQRFRFGKRSKMIIFEPILITFIASVILEAVSNSNKN
jgi:hypothetical protein